MSLPLVVVAIAVLLTLIAVVEALASRLSLPQSVMLASLGILVGLFAAFGGDVPHMATVAALFRDLPLSAETLTLLLLPPLLFDAALRTDARRMLDDAAPIFLLAVMAVCVSTFAIGFALGLLGIEPLLVCLLVGAIVSTTDPLAVLSIFRDVGAPARLVRIVEGESLLNDAAAIALFTILLGAVAGGEAVTFGGGLVVFLVTGVGGLAAGAAIAVAASPVMAATRNHPAALVSVTVALPYIAYIVCEEFLHTSGAMAVVAAGLVTASRSQSGRSPGAWGHVKDIWEQVAFWASSLVFVLSAFLVPTLLRGIGADTILATGVLIAAAFAARAFVLWGVLPLIRRISRSQRIGGRAKILLWWGGLRGSLTILLALSVTEHETVGTEAQEFVAVLATLFVLFTILVNGLTLRPLTRLLGLHRLSPFDKSLGQGARALATMIARSEVEAAATRYRIASGVAAEALAAYDEDSAFDGSVPVRLRERLALALVVMTQAERAALVRHVDDQVISPRVAEVLNREALRMREATRAGGRTAYLEAARRILRFGPGFRLALLVHRLTGWRGPLSEALAERFERLMVRRMILAELAPFADARIAPVLGSAVAGLCQRIIRRRQATLDAAIAALGLQYPHYAAAMEQRFLERIALAVEQREYRALREEGLIGAEISSALSESLAQANRRSAGALRLDLSVDKRALVLSVPLFASLPDAVLAEVLKALRARFVVPGERIIRRGERDDTVFFIASGAAEVNTGAERITLGSGTCVGELAAFSGDRRSADVTMLGYGELLVLRGDQFRAMLNRDATLRREIEAIVEARRGDRTRPDAAIVTS
jgi:CPA1 family monovalent cation:H+ antiporter